MQDHISQLELVQALSSNNTDLVLASILKLNSVPHTHIPAYGSPLHLVMALCPKHIVIQVIDIFCIAAGATKLARGWVNIRNNPDGQTPLHLASKLCRHDICSRLFDIDGLDDTVCDSLGRNAEELADTDEMLTIFIQQKAALNRACISAIKFIIENWESSPNPHAIKEILTSTPRIRAHLTLGWIDINAPFESEKKQSMLHIFAHLESFEVVDFLLKIGADPDIKDVRGKKPIDTTSSEKIKERLRSAISLASIVSPSITKSLAQPTTVQSIEPPLLKGELLKWTNYTTGYKPRYFILEGGIFSYFQTEQGAPHDCRGSISTLSLTVEFPDAVDHSRFDIRGGGDVRYSLKARSPAESKKWIWALMESQRCMKDIEKSRKTPVPMEVQIEAPMAESFNVLPTLPSSSTHSSQNIATVRSNENRSSPDMNKLFYLLQVQLQVQLEAIETVKSALSEESGNTTNIMNANSILSDTSSLIRETGIKILDAHNLREQSWQGKLDKEIQARKRWEDIIQKMIAEKPAEEPLVQQELPEYHGDTTDDEVFYDAAGGEDDFIDTAFGYERFSESRGDTPTPTGFTKETSGTARTFITDQDIHDVSCCYEFEKRTSLPLDPKASRPKLAIWSFLKSAIGKDLSKIPLPVMFNEPSSMLQRMCEDVEYVELLSLAGAVAMPTKSFSSAAIKAAASLDIDIVNLVALTTEEQEYLALMLVAAFAMSNYSSTPGRLSKPFNPLLVNLNLHRVRLLS